MSLFQDWKLQKRKVKKPERSNKELQVRDMIHDELQNYIKREDLEKQLDKIERDKEKRKLWNSLSDRKKIKLLRFVEGKKGVSHGKQK